MLVPTFAVLADLHGNLPATEAVLADLASVRPDRVVLAGDYINRGPYSRAVIERVIGLGLPAISGNHDTWLATLARGERVPEDWEHSWWRPVRLAVGELAPAHYTWIDQLPFSLRLEVPGAEPVRIVHGSPRGSRDGMGRRRTDADLADALRTTEEPTVIGAHIHYPVDREVEGKHVVVVSSVGAPFNRDIRAQYGLFHWDEAARRWNFEHRAVPYDHEPLYQAWRERGYLDDESAASLLMLREHQTARTHYVPFWEWAAERGLPLTRESLARFDAERG